jgi:hypothetical protein
MLLRLRYNSMVGMSSLRSSCTAQKEYTQQSKLAMLIQRHRKSDRLKG